MFLGQYATALAAADGDDRHAAGATAQVESPPMADWLEGFVPMKMHVLIRFGKWREIIAAPLPDDQELFCTTTAMIHYAKAVAHAATGNRRRRSRKRGLFGAARRRVPPTPLCSSTTLASTSWRSPHAMMEGEIAYRKGRFEAAFAHLRRAVALDDGLPYDEPWGWMQPTRHALGALLLEQGQVEEAAAVYRADLGLDDTLRRACQHPDNVWSLHGLHECLMRLGRDREAAIVKQRLDLAAARADVPIKASCFCRLEHPA